ncbi:hypothetical protein GCM10023075_73350 [Streptosporangium album]
MTRIASAREPALHGAELRGVKQFDAVLPGLIAMRIHPDAHIWSALVDSVISERRGPLPGTDDVEAAALSADGRTAVTGSRRGADVWDVTDPSHPVQVAALDVPGNEVNAVALDADGRTATVATPRWGR